MIKGVAVVLASVAVVCCILLDITEGKVTPAQLEANQKLVRRICQPKNNVTTELIDGMRNGEFPEDRNLKCYVKCVMGFVHATNLDDALRNIDLLLPDEIKEATKAQAMACKDIHLNYKDKCEAAFNTLKCMTEFDPNNYTFP